MKHPIIYTILACALLASCSSDSVTDDTATQGRMPIILGVTTDDFTRYTESNYTALVRSGFYLTIWGDQGYLYQGKVEMDDNDGQWKFQDQSQLNSEGEIYWPQGTVHFRAIIGTAEMYNDPDEFYIPTNQDVLVASADLSLENVPNATATLTFTHLLPRVAINLSLLDDFQFARSVTVTNISLTHNTATNRYFYTSSRWRDSDGTETTYPVSYRLTKLLAPGEASPTSDFSFSDDETVTIVPTDEESPFLVIPGTYTFHIEYQPSGSNNPLSKKATLTFDAGQSYNLNITLTGVSG